MSGCARAKLSLQRTSLSHRRNGALIIPFLRINPRSINITTTCVKSCFCKPCCINKLQNRPSVSPVGDLIARIYPAKFRKGPASDHLCHHTFVRQDRRGFAAYKCETSVPTRRACYRVLLCNNFVIMRLYERDPLSPRNDAVDLLKRLFLRPHSSQLVCECRQPHLFVHAFILYALYSISYKITTFICA